MSDLSLLKTESEFDKYDESVVSVVIRSQITYNIFRTIEKGSPKGVEYCLHTKHTQEGLPKAAA